MIEGTNEFVTQLIVALAIPAAAWMIGQAIRAGVAAWSDFKDSQPDTTQVIERVAEIAVRAAEQTGFVAGVKKAGSDKLRYAVDLAAALLEKQGVKLDRALIVGAIEAAVNELFPKIK